MNCVCSCPCCGSALQIGKLLAYPDGTIEPLELDYSLSPREHELLTAILTAFPKPVQAGEAIYGSRSAEDRHAGRVLVVHLRAKLRPWGLEVPCLPGRGYTLKG